MTSDYLIGWVSFYGKWRLTNIMYLPHPMIPTLKNLIVIRYKSGTKKGFYSIMPYLMGNYFLYIPLFERLCLLWSWLFYLYQCIRIFADQYEVLRSAQVVNRCKINIKKKKKHIKTNSLKKKYKTNRTKKINNKNKNTKKKTKKIKTKTSMNGTV